LSQGVLAPANWKSTSSSLGHVGGFSDGVGNESKVKKVKLKVGGITRTITAKSASDGASAVAVGSSSSKSSRFPDPRQKTVEVLPIKICCLVCYHLHLVLIVISI
jgi:INO80 complex subunit B